MKEVIISMSLIVLFQMASYAQENAISIGPRIGVNFSNVSGVDDSKTSLGLALGITSVYSVSENSGISLDILYSQEGYEINDVEVDLDYISIPIYYTLFFGKLGEKMRPKIFVGVVPKFLIGAKSGDTDIKENSADFGFDVSGGLGLNYRVSSKIWLNLDLRAFLGLTDLRGSDFQQGDSVVNRNVQLSLGMAYGLSKY